MGKYRQPHGDILGKRRRTKVLPGDQTREPVEPGDSPEDGEREREQVHARHSGCCTLLPRISLSTCFLMQSGVHPSQCIMDTDRTTARTRRSDMTTQRSDVSGGSNFDRTIDDLRGFNSSLKDELAELKGYVHQTQSRLGQLESLMDEEGVSYRSGASSRRSTARSGRTTRSDASSVISAARSAIDRSRSRAGTPGPRI